jgi:phage gp29-like protein
MKPVLYDAAGRQILAAEAPKAEREVKRALAQVLKHDARERWTGLTTREMTPGRVESILRGALGGDLLQQHMLFDLMEDTWPRLKKNLNRVKRAVVAAPRIVQPYVADGHVASTQAEDKARFLEQVIYNFHPDPTREESSWEDTIYDVMDAFGKGFSVNEILWDQRGGSEWWIKATVWAHPMYYGYPFDEARLKLCVNGDQTNWSEFPADKFIVSRFRTKTGLPAGQAMLRTLAAFWVGANYGYEWLLNFAQLFGIPIRWATYDPTKPGLLDDVCDMLANLGSAGWGAFPQGTTLELKEAVQRAADNPQSFLMTIADLACDLIVLGQTLTSDVGSSGSLALGDVHAGVEAEVIDYCAGWCADVFNYQLIPPLMRFNFGNNDEDPYIESQTVRPVDGKAMAERDKALFVDIGLPVSKKFLYERHGVPMPEEGEELLEDGRSEMGDVVKPAIDDGLLGAAGDLKKQEQIQGRRAVKQPGARLRDNVMERLTGVQAAWLRPVAGVFDGLIAKARDGKVSDADLLQAVEAAADRMPELFPDLVQSAADLRRLMMDAMGAAVVNGAQLAPTAKAEGK